MFNSNILVSEITNTRLVKIYRTKQPISEFWFEGLGNLHFHAYIMELDNGKKYEFHYDSLGVWDDLQEIVELESEFKNDYTNAQIVDVILDSEFQGVYFKMEGDMILYHNNAFGSELSFEKYANFNP